MAFGWPVPGILDIVTVSCNEFHNLETIFQVTLSDIATFAWYWPASDLPTVVHRDPSSRRPLCTILGKSNRYPAKTREKLDHIK